MAGRMLAAMAGAVLLLSPMAGAQTPAENPAPLSAGEAQAPWVFSPPGAEALSLQAAIDQTLAQHPDILAAREKISEMQAKRAMVKNKRLLFFFRYFNASFLEGSAESDTQAAREHLEAVSQKATLNSITAYYADIRAILKSYLDYQQIHQQLKATLLVQRQFEAGEHTGLAVLEEKNTLLNRRQAYARALTLRTLAQNNLSLALGAFPTQSHWQPADLTFQDGQFALPVYHQAFPTLATLLADPADKRPDSRELSYRRLSIYNLLRANINQFDRNQTRLMQASLAQLDMKLARARQAAEAGVIQAVENLALANQELAMAQERLSLAQAARHQTAISRQAGFSSEKDALDVQIGFDKAQIALLNSQIDRNLAQCRLLYATGELTPNTLRAMLARPAAQAEPRP